MVALVSLFFCFISENEKGKDHFDRMLLFAPLLHSSGAPFAFPPEGHVLPGAFWLQPLKTSAGSLGWVCRWLLGDGGFSGAFCQGMLGL